MAKKKERAVNVSGKPRHSLDVNRANDKKGAGGGAGGGGGRRRHGAAAQDVQDEAPQGPRREDPEARPPVQGAPQHPHRARSPLVR